MTEPHDDYTPSERGFKYDRSFQVKVLGIMLRDLPFLKYVADHIRPEHFTDKILARFCGIFVDVYKEKKCAVTPIVVSNELKKMMSAKKITKEEIPLYVTVFSQIQKNVSESEYVIGEIERFIQHMEMEVSLLRAIGLHKKRKYSDIVTEVHKSYQRATFVRADAYEPLSDDELKARLDYREEVFTHPEKYRGIPTGIPPLDKNMFWKGIGRKELGIIMAPPNGGKSPFLLNAAVNGTKSTTVLFYTLELDQFIFDLRMDAFLSSIPINNLVEMRDAVEEQIREKREKMRGRLFVHDLPPYSLTPSDIDRDIDNYRKQGINPGLVVVDYADIMTPEKSNRERRHDFTDIYVGLRGVAKKQNVGVWSASQSNRSSYKKRTIRLDDVAEDWGKAMNADYVIGLCQTDEESMMKPAQMRFFWAKNRNGPKEMSSATTVDFSRMKMYVIPVVEDWGLRSLTDGSHYNCGVAAPIVACSS
jgi:replicative DNA helicase